MRDIESILERLHRLSDAEKKLIKDPKDYPIISVINGLTLDQRELIYQSIRVKQNYLRDFMSRQKEWISKRVFFIDHDLIERHLDNSPSIINDILSSEVTRSDGQNVRFRLYYAAIFREHIETPYEPLLISFFDTIDKAVSIYPLID